jgi:hypothetical protein
MQFHQSQSEEKAIKSAIEKALNGHEERLMTLFIQQGPQALRTQLKVPNDFVWTIVFDHLVFNLDVLKRCIDLFFPFFKDYVVKNGPVALRELFGIEDARYDEVFEKLLDDMVIARGLLFEHVHAHIDEYLGALKQGRGSDIRTQLGLVPTKYDPTWNEVVNFLLDAFSLDYLKTKQKDQTKTFLGLLQSLLSG